jgi:hypothetical protein
MPLASLAQPGKYLLPPFAGQLRIDMAYAQAQTASSAQGVAMQMIGLPNNSNTRFQRHQVQVNCQILCLHKLRPTPDWILTHGLRAKHATGAL